MMYWIEEEELELAEMVRQGRSLEEIVERFHRSPEAVMLKVKRLGLALPESAKVSVAATATQARPLTAVENLIDYEEAMRMLLGALKRLGEVNVNRQELKKFRLIISGLEAYCNMWLTLQDFAAVEEKVKQVSLTVIELVELKLRDAKTEEEKARLQADIERMRTNLGDEEKKSRIWGRRAFLNPKAMKSRARPA